MTDEPNRVTFTGYMILGIAPDSPSHPLYGYDAWKLMTPYEDEDPVCICPEHCEEPADDCQACHLELEHGI